MAQLIKKIAPELAYSGAKIELQQVANICFNSSATLNLISKLLRFKNEGSLQVWFKKAKSPDVAQPIPQCSLFLGICSCAIRDLEMLALELHAEKNLSNVCRNQE